MSDEFENVGQWEPHQIDTRYEDDWSIWANKRIAELDAKIATKDQALLARDANCVTKDKIIMSLRSELASVWIPVSESVPEPFQAVLCCYVGVYSCRVAFYSPDGGGNGHFSCGEKGSQPATHWMPLPEPPEREIAQQGEEG